MPKPPLNPIEIPQSWRALATHSLAELFPLLEGAEFDELVEDLRKNGLRQSIVVYEGAMLDGRNRNRGCEEANVEPHFVEYTGDDPLGFVIAAKLLHRHLTAGQRAEIAAKS